MGDLLSANYSLCVRTLSVEHHLTLSSHPKFNAERKIVKEIV